MMKRNQLYTVNRWNRPAFMKEEEGNLFYDGGQERRAFIDQLASDYYGSSYGDKGSTMEDYLNTTNAFGISKADNPFSKANISSTGKAALGVGVEMADNIGKSDQFKRGMWDRLDPIHYLANGNESTAGNIAGDVGVGLFKTGAQTGNWQLMVAGAAAKAVGSGINALWGEGLNKEADASNKAGIAQNNNVRYTATSTDGLAAQRASLGAIANYRNAHTGGLFKKKSARRKNLADEMRFNDAMSFADRSFDNAANNIFVNQIDNALANYTAFGGPLDMIDNTDDMGAINYGFLTDYLNEKKRQNDLKNRMVNMPTFMENDYAFGGDMQTNSAKYSVGQVVDVSEAEAKRLKAMGYEFTVIS